MKICLKEVKIIGQFFCSDKKFKCSKGCFLGDNTKKKSITIIMVFLFIILASPWITLMIKSRNLKDIIFGLEKFFNKHFINNDEFFGVC